MSKLQQWIDYQKLNHPLDFNTEQAIAIIEKLKAALEWYEAGQPFNDSFSNIKDCAEQALAIDPGKL